MERQAYRLPVGSGMRLAATRRMTGQIHCEILRRAAEVAGGEDQLAQRLNVRREDMREWVQGKAAAPAGVYILALNILSGRERAAKTRLPVLRAVGPPYTGLKA